MTEIITQDAEQPTVTYSGAPYRLDLPHGSDDAADRIVNRQTGQIMWAGSNRREAWCMVHAWNILSGLNYTPHEAEALARGLAQRLDRAGEYEQGDQVTLEWDTVRDLCAIVVGLLE